MRMDRACAKGAQEAVLTDPAYAFFDWLWDGIELKRMQKNCFRPAAGQAMLRRRHAPGR